MSASPEAQFDAVVTQPFTLQTLAQSRGDEKIHAPLLENARADAMLDVLTRARFQHDRFDAFEAQQMRQQESRRTRSDDSCLRTHLAVPFGHRASQAAILNR